MKTRSTFTPLHGATVVGDCAPTAIDVLHARTRMRILAGLATFIAGTALACVIAYWGWQLFGPAVARIPPRGPRIPLQRSSLPICSAVPAAPRRHRSRRAMRYSEATRACSASSPNTDQRGYALFRLPSGPKLVAQGQEIASGATLVSVQTGRCHDPRRRGRAALRPSQCHDNAGSRCKRCGRPVGPASRSDGCACQCRRHVRPTCRIPRNRGATQYRTAGRDRRGLRAMAYVARIRTRRSGRSRRQRLRRDARSEGRRSHRTGERHCARRSGRRRARRSCARWSRIRACG